MSSSINHIAVVVLAAHLSLATAAVLVRAETPDPKDNPNGKESAATLEPMAPFAPYGRDTIWTGIIPPAAPDDSNDQNAAPVPTPDAPTATPAPAP